MSYEYYPQTDKDFLEYLKTIKKGDWIITCKFEIVRFNEWDEPKDLSRYDNEYWNAAPEEERELFRAYDDFTTMEGSSHSSRHCSIWRVSEEYATWFNKNILPIAKYLWEKQTAEVDFADMVEEICLEQGMKFEGA